MGNAPLKQFDFAFSILFHFFFYKFLQDMNFKKHFNHRILTFLFIYQSMKQQL